MQPSHIFRPFKALIFSFHIKDFKMHTCTCTCTKNEVKCCDDEINLPGLWFVIAQDLICFDEIKLAMSWNKNNWEDNHFKIKTEK